jgi:hypothetical protein
MNPRAAPEPEPLKLAAKPPQGGFRFFCVWPAENRRIVSTAFGFCHTNADPFV